jgi:hypothetical protein
VVDTIKFVEDPRVLHYKQEVRNFEEGFEDSKLPQLSLIGPPDALIESI